MQLQPLIAKKSRVFAKFRQQVFLFFLCCSKRQAYKHPLFSRSSFWYRAVMPCSVSTVCIHETPSLNAASFDTCNANQWSGQKPSMNENERWMNCGLFLHICLAVLLKMHFVFRTPEPEENLLSCILLSGIFFPLHNCVFTAAPTCCTNQRIFFFCQIFAHSKWSIFLLTWAVSLETLNIMVYIGIINVWFVLAQVLWHSCQYSVKLPQFLMSVWVLYRWKKKKIVHLLWAVAAKMWSISDFGSSAFWSVIKLHLKVIYPSKGRLTNGLSSSAR